LPLINRQFYADYRDSDDSNNLGLRLAETPSGEFEKLAYMKTRKCLEKMISRCWQPDPQISSCIFYQ
jgi:hypothetical protein